MTLCRPHRYVILRRGVPVYTTDEVDSLLVYLWGRDIKAGYVVYDYERPSRVDTPDLLAWSQRLKARARREPVPLEELGA